MSKEHKEARKVWWTQANNRNRMSLKGMKGDEETQENKKARKKKEERKEKGRGERKWEAERKYILG